ncbi:MAG TPA: hypothetical protein VFR97_01090 [Capillimicrobium sp.]|nr:hypothetical protein [Capillimicrobium sp.]
MHPAAHRALRELIATATLLRHRWERLADRLPDAAEPLRAGARDADAMVDAIAALAEARGVAAGSAASGVGATFGTGMARLGEPFLERNQSLRTAVLHAHHTTLLLHYLERVARADADGELADACHDWAHRLVPHEGAVRDLALAEGDDPDRATEPVDPSPVGRAAHGVAVAVGAAGEWVDTRLG